jgi:NAD(P)-dependent dehydrogenase (short-subunit alcohol dehydrogenase family)
VRSVLVTGASTGIGRATALRLDAAGWKVHAGVRREEDAGSLRAAGSERLQPLLLDVLEANQIAAAGEMLAADPEGLGGVVNNAGVAIPGPLETIDIDDFRRQIEINLTAHVAVTQAVMPAIRRGNGRVVFISSIGGRISFPMTGAYHAAKFGVEAVGDALRQELRPWGLKVVIVEPGSIDTPIWSRGEASADAALAGSPRMQELYGTVIERYRKVVHDTAERGIPPEKVAAAIEQALTAKRPKARYLVGIDAKIQARIKPFIPTPVFDAIVARMMDLGEPPEVGG